MTKMRIAERKHWPLVAGCRLVSTLTSSCDVHDGQYVDIFVNNLAADPAPTSAYCSEADEVAGLAIETVRSR